MKDTVQRSTLTRAERLGRFSEYMCLFVNNHGGPAAIGFQTGIDSRTVQKWCDAKSIPYLRTLMDIIKAYRLDDLEANRILNSAGKPPIAQLRRKMAYGTATLPTLLVKFRDSVGGRQAAAEITGMAVWEFSRLANGSLLPRTARRVSLLARVLKISEREVLVAAGMEHSELAVKVREANAGIPGLVRELMTALELDSYVLDDRVLAAAYFDVRPVRLEGWLKKGGTVSIPEAKQLATAANRPLAGVLERTGIASSVATRIAEASSGSLPNAPLSALLKKYRATTGLTQQKVAYRCPSIEHGNTLAQYESGRCTPSPEILVELADALGAPLERLLAAYSVA